MNKMIKKTLLLLICGMVIFGSLGVFANKAPTTVSADESDIEVVIVTDANRDKWYNTTISSNIDETYDPTNRIWQGIPAIEKTGNRLWVTFMAGGHTEPHDDNYIVLAYSDDDGKTWVEPYLFLRNANYIRNCVPYLWHDENGVLWLYFIGNSKLGGGTHAIKIYNPEGDIKNVTVSKVLYLNYYNFSNRPIVLNDGTYLVASERTNIHDQVIVLQSKDKGETWTEFSRVQSVAENKYFQEGEIIQLSDGTLWCVSRIERGSGDGIERAISTDNGKTWTTFEPSIGYPFVTPGSKVDLVTLSNKDILFTTNASTSSRKNLTTYLSQDNGKTWHELLIDERTVTSYPQSCEDDEGNIYIIYDCNRGSSQSNGNYPSMEIRGVKLTREMIKTGDFNLQRDGFIVSRNDEWREIVSVENVQSVISVEKGQTKEAVLQGMPKYVKVLCDDGKYYTLRGEWKTLNYSENEDYQLKFVAEIEDSMSDTYGLLKFTVTYKSANKPSGGGGCNSSMSGATLTSLVGLLSLAFLKKKYK